METNPLIFVCVILMCFWIWDLSAMVCTSSKYGKLLRGYKIKHVVFLRNKPIQLYQCGVECYLRTMCLSFAYQTEKKECFLYESDSNTSSLKQQDFYIQSDIYTWTLPESKFGECARRPCPVFTKCIHLSSGNYTCVLTDCDYPTKITNMTISSLRTVGKKLNYKCDNTSITPVGDTTIQCKSNGQYTVPDASLHCPTY